MPQQLRDVLTSDILCFSTDVAVRSWPITNVPPAQLNVEKMYSRYMDEGLGSGVLLTIYCREGCDLCE